MNRFIAFDVETPNRENNRMSAIGISVIENGEIIDEFYSLVNPETYFNYFNTKLTGIDEDMVADAPNFADVWQKIEPIFDSGILVAHNAAFDLGVLKKCLASYNISWTNNAEYLCTVRMGRKLKPEISHKLDDMCDYYGIQLNHHHAGSDSRACAEILLRYIEEGADIEKYINHYCF